MVGSTCSSPTQANSEPLSSAQPTQTQTAHKATVNRVVLAEMAIQAGDGSAAKFNRWLELYRKAGVRPRSTSRGASGSLRSLHILP